MNTLIGQASTSPPTVPLTPSPLIEGSLIAAVVVYLIKEGVSFFKKKDEDEAKLTATLIQDLRTSHREQLQQQVELLIELRASHQQIAQAVEKMSTAIGQINVKNQQSSKLIGEILMLLREHSKQFVLIQERIIAIQKRHTSHEQHSANGKVIQ